MTSGFVSVVSPILKSAISSADPKEKQPVRSNLANAVFHPTSCDYYNLCARFKTLLGLPGQLLAVINV